MNKRERVEDLGRIYEIAHALSRHELFDHFDNISKYCEFDEYISKMTQERRDDFIHDLRHWVSYIEEKLYELEAIACGSDDLNYRLNDSILP